MYGRNEATYHDWVGQEWASEDPITAQEATAHWTKDQWVGDRGHGLPLRRTAAQMLEGESGLSGFRHNSPATHWAPVL